MTEILAVVEHGQIKLPASVHLPEGQTMRVAWGHCGICFGRMYWHRQRVTISCLHIGCSGES